MKNYKAKKISALAGCAAMLVMLLGIGQDAWGMDEVVILERSDKNAETQVSITSDNTSDSESGGQKKKVSFYDLLASEQQRAGIKTPKPAPMPKLENESPVPLNEGGSTSKSTPAAAKKKKPRPANITYTLAFKSEEAIRLEKAFQSLSMSKAVNAWRFSGQEKKILDSLDLEISNMQAEWFSKHLDRRHFTSGGEAPLPQATSITTYFKNDFSVTLLCLLLDALDFKRVFIETVEEINNGGGYLEKIIVSIPRRGVYYDPRHGGYVVQSTWSPKVEIGYLGINGQNPNEKDNFAAVKFMFLKVRNGDATTWIPASMCPDFNRTIVR